jgi:hypothetical protein
MAVDLPGLRQGRTWCSKTTTSSSSTGTRTSARMRTVASRAGGRCERADDIHVFDHVVGYVIVALFYVDVASVQR